MSVISKATNSFNHALYTEETARWRALLDLSVFLLNQRLPTDVEDYLVFLLVKKIYCHGAAATNSVSADTKELAERCLLVSGLFPEQPLASPFSFRFFIDAGIDSYRELAKIDPGQEPYNFLSQHFTLATDVLHQFRALCTGQEVFNLIQAYEVWLETGSHYAKHLLANASDGFPLGMRHHLSIH